MTSAITATAAATHVPTSRRVRSDTPATVRVRTRAAGRDGRLRATNAPPTEASQNGQVLASGCNGSPQCWHAGVLDP